MARVMEITTPLGADALLFHRMHATDEMSRLSEYDIELLSKKNDIDLDKILAKNVTVKLELPERKTRFFNGFVTRFVQVGMHGRYHLYRATVRPWLWFLTRRANCRIFQELSVPDIVRKVFDDYPIADVKLELTESYAKRNYCVQYRETDFNFVSRLLEEEGIYYYFNHADGRHTLVLVDSSGAHAAFDDYAELPYIPIDRAPRLEQEFIHEWNLTREVQPGRFVLDDFDPEKPSVDLQVKSKFQRNHDQADFEVFDYPGEYLKTDEGEHYVQTRMDEWQHQFELVTGRGNARGVVVGSLVKLTGHPRNDQNREHLVLSSEYDLEYTQYEALEDTGAKCSCRFTGLDSKQQFRPPRTSTKTFVQGPQTAIVVGPSGDEIYTDKYGRVKVQFHWDRLGKNNENSSCWVRVSHPWAGKNWGMVAIPRIGQEVVVDFLEGDPDQPIITGRVYNAEQMPPWELPGNKTQSGVLTRSSKGGSGGNANSIRFEDKKGSEQLWIHAEKNQDIEVESDETHWVGHDRKKTIDNDETTHVKNDRTETVDNNETITIHANRTEKVDAEEKITIGGGRTEDVGANEKITIAANRDLTVGANETITVGASRTEMIGASSTQTIGAAATQTIAAAYTQTVAGPINVTSGGPTTFIAAGGFNIIAPGGTKIVDFQLGQIGGTNQIGYGFQFNFSGINLEANVVKGEATACTNAAIGIKTEVVGVETLAATAVQKATALEALSNATGIEMDALKIFL